MDVWVYRFGSEQAAKSRQSAKDKGSMNSSVISSDAPAWFGSTKAGHIATTYMTAPVKRRRPPPRMRTLPTHSALSSSQDGSHQPGGAGIKTAFKYTNGTGADVVRCVNDTAVSQKGAFGASVPDTDANQLNWIPN
jgi:hypothetical protein